MIKATARFFGIFGMICLIVVFGRMRGIVGGDAVLFHPFGTDMSFVAKTTASGYFVVELPPGQCRIDTFSGFSREITIPDDGILIWDSGDYAPVQRGLNSAIRDLQVVTGLRGEQ